jgi:hypothetical protein
MGVVCDICVLWEIWIFGYLNIFDEIFSGVSSEKPTQGWLIISAAVN